MTDFKVTDEAVEAAENARVKCLNALTSYGSAGVDERHNMAMKAAIEAALPVMFERVAFVNPVLLNAVTEHNFLDKVNHKVRLRYEPKNSLEIPLYRIKEPK